VRSLCCVLLSVVLVPFYQATGQSFKADTAFIAEARANAIKRYTDEVGVNSNFYNGSQYIEYSPQTDEHPYLLPDWTYGSVTYGGERYDHVSLLLDVAEDQLITTYSYGNPIRLVREKVGAFTMNDKSFVRVSDPQVPAGFYQLVYSGETRFLIKRRKTFYTKVDGNDIRNAYDLKVDYYLYKNGTYHNVRGERSLLAPLADRKQDVKKFMREQHIRYGADKERAAISILGFYDQITR